MDIEYAKKMTKEEVDKFFHFINKKQEELRISSEHIIETMREQLLTFYYEIEEKQLELSSKYDIDLERCQEMKDKNICSCGSTLRYISGYDFWGCPNYKDGGVHYNYSGDKTPYKKIVCKDFVYTIIKSNKLTGKINAKRLYQFYMDQGLDDLMLKYYGKSQQEGIDTFSKVKEVSDAFEKREYKRLFDKYLTCIYQFPIKYKLKFEKEKKCFIDIICSNKEEVHIYECKTNPHDIDPVQNQLYLNLIKFMDTTGRKVEIYNLIENK